MKRVPAPNEIQPDSFAFTPENLEKAKQHIAKYPPRRQASAVMPLLDLAQRQHENWLPRAAMDAVAEMLEMPRIRVYEVATFYTMYNLAPVGEHFVQVCTTTPCWLRGSDDVISACKSKTGVEFKTANGRRIEDVVNISSHGQNNMVGASVKSEYRQRQYGNNQA